MKSFIIFGFLVSSLLQAEGLSVISVDDGIPKVASDTIRQSQECFIKMGPTKAAQIAQTPQIFGMEEIPEDNPLFNEMLGCMWEKKGIITEQGVLNEEELENYLVDILALMESSGSTPHASAHDITQQCKKVHFVHGNDYGQTAVKIQNCIYRYIIPK